MQKSFRAALFAGVICASALPHAAYSQPAIEHQAMLKKLIADAAVGHIDYATMAPQLAEAVRPQAATAQSELSALGALRSVSLSSKAPDGMEIYRAVFEKGDLDWAFHVDEQGRIDNAIYRPVRRGQP